MRCRDTEKLAAWGGLEAGNREVQKKCVALDHFSMTTFRYQREKG